MNVPLSEQLEFARSLFHQMRANPKCSPRSLEIASAIVATLERQQMLAEISVELVSLNSGTQEKRAA